MNTSNITNYKPKDFAELLGVSVKTLQRWDRDGTLKANRTPTDRRYYTYDQYLQFKGISTEDDQRQVVIYARVSTRNQKDDLQNQVAFLRQFCNAKGIIVDQCIEDYGSGLNYNRKKWNELLDEVMEQKIKTSCRILFQYSMCSLAGCTDFVSIKNKSKDCRCERHRINIPSLGWVRIKEKGYIPTTKDGYVVKSGTVSMKADRYYVSVLVEISNNKIADNSNAGIGIDLGLKDFAIVSNGKTYKNINKSARLKKLEKQLIREQRCLSRKYENLKKGEVTQRANIQKQKLKVQKLHHKIDNIRTDYINKTIAEIVKTKPSYITIEDLNVNGMMKNRHLSKAVASQKFYEFRTKLQIKCNENGIELRIVDRWYPSSKTCHCCGAIKKDLKLSDRIFKCSCGYVEDRDLNAALNLRDAITYEVA